MYSSTLNYRETECTHLPLFSHLFQYQNQNILSKDGKRQNMNDDVLIVNPNVTHLYVHVIHMCVILT